MLRGSFGFYMMILGMMIGIEFAVGALIAPVIFNTKAILGEGVLSHFQSGQLMTAIFLRFNVVLVIATSLMLCFEAVLLKTKYKDIFSFVLIFLVSVCVAIFVCYYTPYIINAQSLGADFTSTEEFSTKHKGSELVMKVLLMLQIILFFKRFYKNKEKN